MWQKTTLLVFLFTLFHVSASAHGTWQQHADDMYEVFGFERNDDLTDWMRFVSSVLIDNNNADTAFSYDGKPFDFYSYLQEKYPGFKCKHRLLFHWGYNSRPWTPYLQQKVNEYGWSEEVIQEFQADLIAEQKRRNGFANECTENLFHLAHGGKEARVARVMISIAYDVHLLGDYEPDNTDLDGLQDIESVVGDIINNVRVLDKQKSSSLAKELKRASQGQEYDVQRKASALLNILKGNFRILLQNADNGKLAEHFHTHGFRFVNDKLLSNTEVNTNQKKTSTQKEEKRGRSKNSTGIGIVIFFSLAILGVLFALLFKKRN